MERSKTKNVETLAYDSVLLRHSHYGLITVTHHLLCWFEVEGNGNQEQTLRNSGIMDSSAIRS